MLKCSQILRVILKVICELKFNADKYCYTKKLKYILIILDLYFKLPFNKHSYGFIYADVNKGILRLYNYWSKKLKSALVILFILGSFSWFTLGFSSILTISDLLIIPYVFTDVFLSQIAQVCPLFFFFESTYSLVNSIDSQSTAAFTDLFALSVVNVRKKIAESKLEICKTVDLKQLTSMILESDDNVVIELPDKKKFILSMPLPSPLRGEGRGKDFIEWFRGFTDAEGSFKFKATKVNSFMWNFSITLHIDDVEALNYIHNILGVGAVYLSNKYSRASFEVNSQQELLIILAIFAKYNLNSTKHLNYLAFCEAFLLYTRDNSREYRKKLKPILLDILSYMNSKRSKFDLTASHKLHITSNWLLGFVGGDGSFSYARKNEKLIFAIIQKENDPLLYAIKDFLHNLINKYRTVNNIDIYDSPINIYSNPKGISILQVSRTDFLKHILIPLFNPLTFHTKKYLDYCDWVALFNIRQSGFHYPPPPLGGGKVNWSDFKSNE